jgi:hypothetical protein
MTTVVVLPDDLKDCQLERLWDDLLEAIAYEECTGFVTRVTLERFDKNGLPIYTKIPDDELTYAEWRAQENAPIPVELPENAVLKGMQ